MLLQKEREDVVKYCQMLITHGLTKVTGGNISILNREEGLLAISPSGIDYFETEPEDIVVMNLKGEIVDGDRNPPANMNFTAFSIPTATTSPLSYTHTLFTAPFWQL